MAYVDPNDNILKWENGDVVTPQAAKMNMHLDSVGTVTNALRRRGTYTVNNIPERTALVNTIGASNISNSNPLMVWRANADAGKRLEYTENGGTWHYVKTSQDDSGWVQCPVLPGFSPQGPSSFRVRKEGNKVNLEWGISGSGTSPLQSHDVATVPVGYRPPTNMDSYGMAFSNTVAARGVTGIVVLPSGIIQIRTGPTVGGYYLAQSGHSWFVS